MTFRAGGPILGSRLYENSFLRLHVNHTLFAESISETVRAVDEVVGEADSRHTICNDMEARTWEDFPGWRPISSDTHAAEAHTNERVTGSSMSAYYNPQATAPVDFERPRTKNHGCLERERDTRGFGMYRVHCRKGQPFLAELLLNFRPQMRVSGCN